MNKQTQQEIINERNADFALVIEENTAIDEIVGQVYNGNVD